MLSSSRLPGRPLQSLSCGIGVDLCKTKRVVARLPTTNRTPPPLSFHMSESMQELDCKVETKWIQLLLKQSSEIEFLPCFTEEDTERERGKQGRFCGRPGQVWELLYCKCGAQPSGPKTNGAVFLLTSPQRSLHTQRDSRRPPFPSLTHSLPPASAQEPRVRHFTGGA